MVKGARQGPDNIEPQFFPESDGDVITGCDKVELHCAETHRDCNTLGVLAHVPCNAHTAGSRCHNVPAIADVVSRSVLVGFELIGPEDLAIVLKNKCAVRLGHPEGFAGGLIRICGVGIGVAGANDFFKNRPYGWPITRRGVSNHGLS